MSANASIGTANAAADTPGRAHHPGAPDSPPDNPTLSLRTRGLMAVPMAPTHPPFAVATRGLRPSRRLDTRSASSRFVSSSRPERRHLTSMTRPTTASAERHVRSGQAVATIPVSCEHEHVDVDEADGRLGERLNSLARECNVIVRCVRLGCRHQSGRGHPPCDCGAVLSSATWRTMRRTT